MTSTARIPTADPIQVEFPFGAGDANYRVLFERSEDPMWVLADGVFVRANAAAARLLGCDGPEELESMRPEAVSPSVQPCGTRSDVLAQQMIRRADRGNLSLRLDPPA